MVRKLNGLSLFSSAGIGETYIDKWIDMKVANELLKDRCNIYNYFYPNVNMIQGDICNIDIYNKILTKSIKSKVNFIYATPPCQSFSKAGKQAIKDERNILFLYIIKLISAIQPKYVLIENVPEFIKLGIIINGKKSYVLDVIEERLDNYIINYDILNTADYGTAQNRKRSIILLTRNDIDKVWKIPDKKDNIITTKDAIGHLPSLESGEISDIHPYHKAKKHNANHILWMKNTPTGKSAFDNDVYYPQKDGRKIKGFKTTYKRISWDTPAPTITMCNGGISSQNNVHPGRLLKDGLYSDARVLTVYELILLTGLNDDWILPDWVGENLIRHIIGECVPPLLIKYLVENIFK